MKRKRAAAFAVAGTPGVRPHLVAIMSAGGRAVISKRHYACVFCENCSHLGAHAMRAPGKPLSKLHVDLVESRFKSCGQLSVYGGEFTIYNCSNAGGIFLN